MQGRLSQQRHRVGQSFPWDTWQSEFIAAANLGFSHIEWLLERDRWSDNPLLLEHGRKEISQLSLETKVCIDSVCLHCFVTEGFLDDIGRATAILGHCLDAVAEIGVDQLVVPLLEHGSIRNQENRLALNRILESVLVAADASGCRLALECDLKARDCISIVDGYGNNRVGICYDVGNSITFGFDALSELAELGGRVHEIHFKDRSPSGESVPLGAGIVDFNGVAAWLKCMEVEVPIVLETPVAENWHRSAQRNADFVRTLLVEEIGHAQR